MDQAIVERIDPAAVQRELTEAIERTESLGLAIEAHLDDIERELEDIRRTEAQIRYPGHPGPRPELVEGR